jgi:hypothetical protein
MNRWALRVAAYAGLMTDEYPPFRLDMGGHEGGDTVTVAAPATKPEVAGAPSPAPHRSGWTAGRVVSLVIGCVLGLVSLGLLAAGGVATWATNTQRDAAGYLTSDTRTFSTAAYAVTSDGIDLGSSTDWVTPGDVLGSVRIRATAIDPAKTVFLGVAPQAAVNRYLNGVDHLVVTNWANGHTRHQPAAGSAPASAPTAAKFWTAQASGPGRQSLTWRPSGGHWVVLVMNANGGKGVSVTADVGARVPDLGWIAVGLFIAGGVLLAAAVTMIVIPVVRASR